MKLSIRITLSVLCALCILCMPFFLSSPNRMTAEKKTLEDFENDISEDDESEVMDLDDLIGLFVSSARAEDVTVVPETDSETIVEPLELFIPDGWQLPIDFTAPPRPNPACYTEDGYEDQSIRVKVETREMYGCTVDVAFIEIADASQLRTAVAGEVQNAKTDRLEKIARSVNPVIAMNGDLYTQLPEKKTFEVRMSEAIRVKTNNLKDILIIDDLGDFHLFIRSRGLHKKDDPYYISQAKAEGRKIINALTFGPALVKDGELVDQTKNEKEYAYAPNYKNPRSAIGQTGHLSYVMVIVEGRGNTPGATHRELAQIMFDLGCVQAYNLDGGNTAEMIMFGPDGETAKYHFIGDQGAGDRGQKDIIYFGTAVPESEW